MGLRYPAGGIGRSQGKCDQMAPSDFKTRREIADLYGHLISYSRLKKLGMKGRTDGPPVTYQGDRPIYHVPSFERWLLGDQQPAPPAPAPRRKRGRLTKAEEIRRRALGAASAASPDGGR